MARPWSWGRADDITTEPLEGLAPFRRLLNGQTVSGGGSGTTDTILLGLDAPDPVDPALDARLRADLTQVLWGDWGGRSPVPVTYFTDIRCPICRPLEARLRAIEGIALTTREFPVFGEVSELAARAIVTAQQQGLGERMRLRLQRSAFALGREGVFQVAEGAGVDTVQFAADFDGPQVTARLAEDRALARIFRLPGTPGLIVARTRVIGAPSDATLQALIAEEAGLGRP
ncbi:DsbA family protein [Jannaschia sp. CCS1]|uniref:DsbA family protein n=1 Tax=Jannaschia sp. (strain CCS1) TaxID=290400 RepID=UPI000053A98B|nr:DsbA family protein [Jannaschia sp. CCS1]ABD55087.1 DSBA oxidoreductase [Jannaschia sp. CCS1]